MEVLNSLFEMLENGVVDGKDDFHTMVFSNIQNNTVQSRYVVLRSVSEKKRTLTFNTDVRSPKVDAIRNNPETLCLFYHYRKKTQLRISTYSSVHYNDSISENEWHNTSLSSRKCYLSKYAPSQETEEMDDGIALNLTGRIPDLIESECGKKNFAVIVNKIIWIDWLYLSSKGHRRARYEFNNEQVTKAWIAP